MDTTYGRGASGVVYTIEDIESWSSFDTTTFEETQRDRLST
jgi:hypothetical protein